MLRTDPFCAQNTIYQKKNPECKIYPLLFKQIDDILDKYYFNMKLSGHEHYYEQSHPISNFNIDEDGITHIIVGTGGNFGQNTDYNLSNSALKAHHVKLHIGFLEFVLTDQLIVSKFISSNDGAVLDSFSVKSRRFLGEQDSTAV